MGHPVGVILLEFLRTSLCEKTQSSPASAQSLLHNDGLSVLIQCQYVTDRQTDGQKCYSSLMLFVAVILMHDESCMCMSG